VAEAAGSRADCLSGWAERPKDGVLGVDVKVDERRLGHGRPSLALAQDRTQSCAEQAV
jgi:hypothetical protein